MFALLGYQGTPGVNAASFDLTALTDPDFSQRNGHYIFTEEYQLMAACALETSSTGANFSVPTWNAIGKPSVYPTMRSATIPSRPIIDWRMFNAPTLPQNEEFQFQVSNNLGASTEQAYGLMWIRTRDWSRNLPAGIMPIMVRATNTFTPTSASWSGPQAMTFDQSLRGGWYAVIGAEVQGTNLIAFRLIFPRYQLYQGRKLRPGGLCQNSLGDAPVIAGISQNTEFGLWGTFHTFEPVQYEVLMTTGASTACEIRLNCLYLGQNTASYPGASPSGTPGVMMQPGMGAY